MPSRRGDNESIHNYPFRKSTMDRRSQVAAVPPGAMVRAIGVDGRFDGAARVFPPFKRVIDIKAAPFDGTSFKTGARNNNPYYFLPPVDNRGMTEVWFFKYITLQIPTFEVNGQGSQARSRTLRGWAIAHDYNDGVTQRGTFTFYFYDPVEQGWRYHHLLREVPSMDAIRGRDASSGADTSDADWPFVTFYTDNNTILQRTSSYDVASQGSFIYFTVINQTEGAASGFDSIHRSIWCRGIGIDAPASGISPADQIPLNAHSMWCPTPIGPLPTRYDSPAGGSNTLRMHTDSQYGSSLAFMNRTLSAATDDKTYAGGWRMMALAKNAEGPIQRNEAYGPNPNAKVTWQLNIQAYLEEGSSGEYYRRRLPAHLLQNRLRLYRSLNTNIFNTTQGNSFQLGGTQFREVSQEFNDQVVQTKSNPNLVLTGPGGYTAVSADMGESKDDVLVTQRQFDPFGGDDTVFFPREVRLVQPYQGTLLRIGSVPYPTIDIDVSDRDQILSWGALNKFAPEQFRIEDTTPLGASQDEASRAFVAVSDYVFVVGDTSIFRIHRNGNVLAINEIQTLAGGVSRWANVGVGSMMFYVAPNGLYMVDGATGEYQLVSALDRVIQEDWQDSLSSIRMCYDMTLGAVFMLNTQLNQCILLWNNTGNITQLNDITWKWCTQGVDPTTAELNRSWWIGDNGVIYTVNSERNSVGYGTYTEGALSLCGGNPALTWNGFGVALAATTRTYILKTDQTPADPVDPACIGFRAYFLTGERAGMSAVITGVGNEPGVGQYIEHEPLAPGSNTSMIAIAPVIFELVGWPVAMSEGGTDKFLRKHIRSMSHAVYLLGGDININTNPSLLVQHVIYRRTNLTVPLGEPTQKLMSEDSSKNYTYKGVAGTVLYPAWKCWASNADYEICDGLVHVIITKSEAESRA